jgi:hypothetical protein
VITVGSFMSSLDSTIPEVYKPCRFDTRDNNIVCNHSIIAERPVGKQKSKTPKELIPL